MKQTFSEQFAGEKLVALKANLQAPASLSLISKAIESTGKVYTFVVSTPDMDRQGDELDQSKWDFTLFKMNPVALWSHEYDKPPIGAWSNIRQQGDKTLMDLRCVPGSVYPFAGQIEAMIDMGFVNACSVGYMVNSDGTMELLEVSPCSVGANAYALAERDVKKYALDIPMLVAKGFSFKRKGVVPYKDRGAAPEDTAWDGPAQVKACGGDMDQLKGICAWFDGESPDVKSSYKLPHHEADGGKAVWNGVKSAMGAIMGARGGAKIPKEDREGVYNHLKKHYAEFEKDAPEYEKAVKIAELHEAGKDDDAAAVAKVLDFEYDVVTKPEVTEDYVRIPVDEGDHKDDKVRTITISEAKGIKALYCVTCKKVITYLFDTGKWTKAKAEAWVKDHQKKTVKAEQVGDRCETDDGGLGVLAEDEDNPGEMVCVPAEDGKGQKKNTPMKKELLKKLKTEHAEHKKTISGHIDTMEDAMKAVKKSAEADNNTECMKAIDEFTASLGTEQDRHKEAVMKAIDDSWKLSDQAEGEKAEKAKKDIEEFKGQFDVEHDKHVEEFGKAIEEFKSAAEADDEGEKSHVHEDAIEEFKDVADDEHDRHVKAHKAIVKAATDPNDEGETTEEKKGVCGTCGAKGMPGTKHANCPKHKGTVEDIFMMGADNRRKNELLGFVQQVMWAFCDAVWQSDTSDFYELLEEAMGIIKEYADSEKANDDQEEAEEKAIAKSTGKKIEAFLAEQIKSGRKISAATQKAINAVCDALEDHHEQHGEETDKAIADLKAIAEGPGEGEDGASKAAPNKKVGSTKTNPMSEDFNSAMLARDILAAVNTVSQDGLKKLNEKFSRHFGGRR